VAVAPLPRDAGSVFGRGAKKVDLSAVRPAHVGRFYQRALPQTQVAFASDEGRTLFREALAAGHMENYFFLAEQFRTQDEPTFCGLSTLAMVLNSLRIDPMRTWKGAWRWFNEQNLGCCTKLQQVREEGVSFDMFRCLANCNGANVMAHRAPSSGEDLLETFTAGFRAAVRATCRSRERESIVICYSRETLGQSGAGHFSPIGGYHEGTDTVLILDVARFKYPPHWVSVSTVARAMACVDRDTGRPRGYLHLRVHPPESSEKHRIKPLQVAFVPPAAGRLLSSALATALQEAAELSPGDEPTAQRAMRRWLHAASVAEPQVLGKLLEVGDATALRELLVDLTQLPLYRKLCDAYHELVSESSCSEDEADTGCKQRDFPPLLFDGALGATAELEEKPALGTCGELWVLLLLVLPDHLRTAAAAEIGGSAVSEGLAQAVKGPWALPLQALSEVMSHLLPSPHRGKCTNGWSHDE